MPHVGLMVWCLLSVCVSEAGSDEAMDVEALNDPNGYTHG
jgi:hypothetical protein